MRTVHCGKPLVLQHEVREHEGAFSVRLHAGSIARGGASLRIGKHRRIEVDRLLRMAGPRSGEHKGWCDEWPRLATRVGQDELPGEAIFVLDPSVPLAEWIP